MFLSVKTIPLKWGETIELIFTGRGAHIFRQSKKGRQKRGGFSRLLPPSVSFWPWYLTLINRDPEILTVVFTSLDFR
jgi:hypothetical protein